MAKRVPDIKVQFGNRVRHLRQLLGWNQERLADECDLDRSYIGGVERGERNISLENIARIAKALGKSPSFLLDFEGDSNG